jgi:superkiller protein 3
MEGDSYDTLMTRGDEALREQRWAEAAHAYRAALAIKPDDALPWFGLGIALKRSGDETNASEALRKALTIEWRGLFDEWTMVGSFNTLITRGDEALRKERWAEAADAYRKALTIKPEYIDAWYNLAIVLGRSGDMKGAVNASRKAIAINPKDADAWINLGVALFKSDDVEGAIDAFRKTLAINPDHVKAWHVLGIALDKSGDETGAIDAYRKALTIKPDHAEAWYNLGVALDKSRNAKGAIDAYRKALAINPDIAEAWYYLGIVLSRSSDSKGAMEAFKKAIAIKPDYAGAWVHIGLEFFKDEVRNLDEAKRCFQKALDLRPGYPNAMYNLACAHSLAGKASEAMKWLEKAIKIDSEYKKLAAGDSDFDAIRGDPRFQALIITRL